MDEQKDSTAQAIRKAGYFIGGSILGASLILSYSLAPRGRISDDTIVAFTLIAAFIAAVFLFGAIFNAFLNRRRRLKNEQAQFAALSGRTSMGKGKTRIPVPENAPKVTPSNPLA
ncbi:MAG: hypothetical protein ACSHYF_04815 [Verrucomicrobiaceae bacterium]